MLADKRHLDVHANDIGSTMWLSFVVRLEKKCVNTYRLWNKHSQSPHFTVVYTIRHCSRSLYYR